MHIRTSETSRGTGLLWMEKPRWMEERVGHPSELNVRTRWELQGRVRGQARALCCRWGPCVSYCEGFSLAHPCAASYRQVKQEAQPLPQMQVRLDPHSHPRDDQEECYHLTAGKAKAKSPRATEVTGTRVHSAPGPAASHTPGLCLGLQEPSPGIRTLQHWHHLCLGSPHPP